MPAKLRLSTAQAIIRPQRSQICQQCLHRSLTQTRRTISSTTSRHDQGAPARWSHTPERTRAPVPMTFENKDDQYSVNESSEKLDEFYIKLLGEGGDTLLTEEVKWLAVTHKSFDQGRRGYNDKLAFLGKRILDLQSSLALLNRTDGTFSFPPDPYNRQPFQHPGIDLLPRLTEKSREYMTNRNRIANLANRKGMLQIMRWKPRYIRDLRASGVDGILAGGLYAIVGAIAMQRGGEIATRTVQEKILMELEMPRAEE